MPRHTKSDVQTLLQEARALEMLADEAQVEPSKLQDYWSLAAELITLVNDIEEFEGAHPDAGYDEPELLSLRRRVRGIASRLAQISAE